MAQVGTTKFYLTNGKREKFISASGGKVARRVVVGLRPERKERNTSTTQHNTSIVM